MFITISFFTSAFLIAGFLFLRHFEIKRGGRTLSIFRMKLDAVAYISFVYITKTLPMLATRVTNYVVMYVTHLSSSALLHGVRKVEGKLHNFVNIVKGRKEVALREPSPFLKKVADEGENGNYDMEDRG